MSQDQAPITDDQPLLLRGPVSRRALLQLIVNPVPLRIRPLGWPILHFVTLSQRKERHGGRHDVDAAISDRLF